VRIAGDEVRNASCGASGGCNRSSAW
jgi:hypothetical protein